MLYRRRFLLKVCGQLYARLLPRESSSLVFLGYRGCSKLSKLSVLLIQRELANLSPFVLQRCRSDSQDL